MLFQASSLLDIVFIAEKLDLLHRIKSWDGIPYSTECTKLIQQIAAYKICLAFAEGNIPLLVYFAEIFKLDGIAFLTCGILSTQKNNSRCQTMFT